MKKLFLRNKINRFYATLATVDVAYNNCMVTVEDLGKTNILEEILFDLETNFFTYENSRKLYKEVLKLLERTKKEKTFSNIMTVIAALTIFARVRML